MSENEKKTVTEELEVAGSQLVDKVQDLIRQGNIRRMVIRTADDRVLLETSLTVGAVGSAVALIAGGLPLAILGVIAAAVSRVKIEIVREVEEGDVVEGKKKVEIAVEDEE